MKRLICILGSGTMACDIGAFCLKRGYAVTWLAGNADRAAALEREMARLIRRMEKAGFEIPETRYAVRGSVLRGIDIIIECTAEDTWRKQGAIKSILPVLDENERTLLLSASSSFLPSEIHPSCAGCHFFYPVELTCLVEAVCQSGISGRKYGDAVQWMRDSGLEVIEQTEGNAFVINRLLLPLQSEAMRLLAEGYDPDIIDRSSVSELLPLGQLSMMDSVGLDIILSGIENYIRRMRPEEQEDYVSLRDGLKTAVNNGILGRKNGIGLLSGAFPVSSGDKNVHDMTFDKLKTRFYDMFVSSCRNRIITREITQNELDMALKSVFGAEALFSNVAGKIS